MTNAKKSLLLTAAVAGLLSVTACSTTQAQSAEAKDVGMCYGVNACKGHGDCAGKVDACSGSEGCSAKTSCAGKNSCKGKGFKKLSKKECMDKGGKFQA